MSADTTGDERRWMADKRDFVADSRDDAADSRESVADAREASADAWETALDEWEGALGSRATLLGMDDPSAAERAEAREAREAARHERDRAREGRRLARVHREDAAGRRLDGAPPTLLALAFAGIAEHLYNADDYDEVLARIAETAVETVTGARFASVTLVADGGYRSAGSTAAAATAVDQEQYDADEGPSLDALTTPVVDAPEFPDERWPALAARPTDHGVHSVLSYQLVAGSTGEPGTGSGSLNVYASAPAAFGQEAREIGLILASHASLAARAVGERASLQGLGEHLEHALLSRDVIGQAKGILMERLKTTPEDAFDILKNSSQRLNLKLREVARRLTETGEVDTGDLPGR